MTRQKTFGVRRLAQTASPYLALTALPLLWAAGAQGETWDGGAGTANWHDAANWSADVVPDAASAGSIASANVQLRGGTAATSALQVGFGSVNDVAVFGNATLTVDGGAVLTSSSATINSQSGYSNAVTVTDGSSWTVSGTTNIGSRGPGLLTISDGSTVVLSGNTMLGSSTGGVGTIAVSGAELTFGGRMYLGFSSSARAVLSLSDGAVVTASTIEMYNGTGTLIFGAAEGQAARAAGTLVANGITMRSGLQSIVFNHTAGAEDPLVFGVDVTRSYANASLRHLAGVTDFAAAQVDEEVPTSVTGGTLLVSGTLLGTMNVSGTGTLGGTGTVGNTAVFSGARLSPGMSGAIGTLSVTGDLTLATGSTYAIDVGANGVSDRTVVTGNAYISDGAVLAVSPVAGVSYATGWDYTVLEAASISGRFADATQVSGDFATFTTRYTDTDVSVAVAALGGRSGTLVTEDQSANQQSVAAALAGSGVNTALYNAAFLTRAGQSGAVLGAMAGDIYPSTRTAILTESQYVRGAINNRLRHVLGDVASFGAEAGDPETPRAWGTAFGGSGDLDSDGNAAALETSNTGFVLGFDALSEAGFRLGIAAAKLSSSYDGAQASGDGSGYHLAFYGGAEWGPVSLRTGLAWGRTKVSVERTVAADLITNTRFGENLAGDYRANTRQAFAELGYRIERGDLRLEPFAGLAHVELDSEELTEEGGSTALVVDEADMKASYATLGLRAARAFDLQAARAVVSGSVGWRHAFGDLDSVSTHGFASGEAFSVRGLSVGRDVAVIEAGVDVAISPNATLGVAYTGQQGSDGSDHGVNARFNLRF